MLTHIGGAFVFFVGFFFCVSNSHRSEKVIFFLHLIPSLHYINAFFCNSWFKNKLQRRWKHMKSTSIKVRISSPPTLPGYLLFLHSNSHVVWTQSTLSVYRTPHSILSIHPMFIRPRNCSFLVWVFFLWSLHALLVFHLEQVRRGSLLFLSYGFVKNSELGKTGNLGSLWPTKGFFFPNYTSGWICGNIEKAWIQSSGHSWQPHKSPLHLPCF